LPVCSFARFAPFLGRNRLKPYTKAEMPADLDPMPDRDKRRAAAELLHLELHRLGRAELDYLLCFSDTSWREAMQGVACPAYIARLASPTTRRGTRGKLGMATICHARHGHPGVVYIRTHGRDWPAVAETVRHEALHLARPSYSHRQVEAALRHKH
jgi:hypothetical protein